MLSLSATKFHWKRTKNNKKCQRCDSDYTTWNNLLKQRKAEIETIFDNLIKRYEINVNELRTLLKTFAEKLEHEEKALNVIGINNDKIQKEREQVLKKIEKLKNDLKEVEEMLKRLGSPNSKDQNILKYLTEIKETIRKLVGILKTLKFDLSDNNIFNLVDEFNAINKNVTRMLANFPNVRKNSLNLLLTTEKEIDLLESIIANYGNYPANFSEGLKTNTQWIEKDLTYLFNLLNNYYKVSLDINGLKNNATRVRSMAKNTSLKLDQLLQDHENFEKLVQKVKNETIFYEELQRMKNRLGTLKQKIAEFQQFLKILKDHEEVENELENLNKIIREFNEKEKIIRTNRGVMDKHLKNLNELIERYEKLKVVKSVEKIIVQSKETKRKTQEVEEIIAEHCKDGIK
ncbi:putative leucine-rich repeat-containing protein DDB_G0290503 [Tribolium madens]|uniref:putative leucine-rich repeat-containing protein DDB_G0290503 n=1 Tax=Tribolium madens TaxID=41895 RepID=UPI001CF721AC|nr:putative leucine-rich repeat-containing protein DDB_G0290503 [Tribolium madens]